VTTFEKAETLSVLKKRGYAKGNGLEKTDAAQKRGKILSHRAQAVGVEKSYCLEGLSGREKRKGSRKKKKRD